MLALFILGNDIDNFSTDYIEGGMELIGCYKTPELCIKAAKIYFKRTHPKIKYECEVINGTISTISFKKDNSFVSIYGFGKISKDDMKNLQPSTYKVKL